MCTGGALANVRGRDSGEGEACSATFLCACCTVYTCMCPMPHASVTLLLVCNARAVPQDSGHALPCISCHTHNPTLPSSPSIKFMQSQIMRADLQCTLLALSFIVSAHHNRPLHAVERYA